MNYSQQFGWLLLLYHQNVNWPLLKEISSSLSESGNTTDEMQLTPPLLSLLFVRFLRGQNLCFAHFCLPPPSSSSSCYYLLLLSSSSRFVVFHSNIIIPSSLKRAADRQTAYTTIHSSSCLSFIFFTCLSLLFGTCLAFTRET